MSEHDECEQAVGLPCAPSEPGGARPGPRGNGEPRGGGHGHSRGGHSHDHARASRTRLLMALGVTAGVMAAELVAAHVSGSLSLAADAGHMAVDSSGLVVALVAAHLMTRPRDDRHTWGWARSEVLAAALQAGMLAIICTVVAWEAVWRLVSPGAVEPVPMLVVGAVGLIANGASLLILMGGRGSSLNMRAAFLEVANDALGSVAVIAAAACALATGWSGADAVASLLIAALMAPRALGLLRKSVAILMERTPHRIELAQVREHMLAVPGVTRVHDLHVTTVATGLVAVTAHVEVSPAVDAHGRDLIVHSLGECAAHHFPVEIAHSTFQLECAEHAAHEHLAH